MKTIGLYRSVDSMFGRVSPAIVLCLCLVMPTLVFGEDKLVVKNEAGATTFKVEDNGTITNSSTLLANGATTWGSAPMVLGQNPLNRGIIITDKAASNPKIISIGWNVGNTFDYMEIFAVHHGVAFKNIVLAPTGGNVGIGTTGPKYLIDTGGAYCNGSKWVNASSRKYKENIKELTADEAMDTLRGLNPVKFNYKISSDEQSVGFIAEDVPTLVASKDRKGMSPMDVVAVLTKVVQEQQRTIAELSRKVANLENRIKIKEEPLALSYKMRLRND